MESLIRAQCRVIDLYREVLATHEMPEAERISILTRIARMEAELQALCATRAADKDHQDSSFDFQRAA